MSESKQRMRIVSDGTAESTHVFDESGKELLGIRKISWTAEPGKVVCYLELVRMDVELEAKGAVIEE